MQNSERRITDPRGAHRNCFYRKGFQRIKNNLQPKNGRFFELRCVTRTAEVGEDYFLAARQMNLIASFAHSFSAMSPQIPQARPSADPALLCGFSTPDTY
jgi:hypothetical protein